MVSINSNTIVDYTKVTHRHFMHQKSKSQGVGSTSRKPENNHQEQITKLVARVGELSQDKKELEELVLVLLAEKNNFLNQNEELTLKNSNLLEKIVKLQKTQGNLEMQKDYLAYQLDEVVQRLGHKDQTISMTRRILTKLQAEHQDPDITKIIGLIFNIIDTKFDSKY